MARWWMCILIMLILNGTGRRARFVSGRVSIANFLEHVKEEYPGQ